MRYRSKCVGRDSVTSQEESKEEKLSRALLSWSHPETAFPLPQGFADGMSVESRKAIQRHLEVRKQEWQEAFASIYFMLRTNRCPCLYLKVPSKRMVVLFCGPTIAGRGSSATQGHAIITRSTRGVRHLLSESGVKFNMPLWKSKENQEESREGAKYLDELERLDPRKVRRVSETAEVDGEPESLLFIDGTEQVHGLFNLLFNYGVSDQIADVPLLLAPVAFKHARVSPLQLVCRKTMEAATSSGVRKDATAPNDSEREARCVVSYKAECRPNVPIPPWVVARVGEVFAKSQREYSACLQTDPLCNRLNAHFGMARACKRPRWELQGESKQMTDPPLLKGLSIYRAACKHGKYVLKLTV
mmetsp:Transcript_10276/g.21445  ORF Transcript_10276/g.21445 Transcript_10276/m.21445 type:complete len:359 (-) Transcript_10276:84-1160(-)